MLINNADRVTALALLDLCAAFDTIHHSILLRRLDDWFGVTGKALDWFESYLTRRGQRITHGNCLSSKADLIFGVPQGSVLGPLLSRSIPLHWAAWSVNMLSLTISMLMTACCMFPLHQGTLLQHWMVYSCVWPLSSHGCRRINWNWALMKLNFSLLGMSDSGVDTSLCFPLSFSVSGLNLLDRPQGSGLGLLLFTLYTTPLSSLIPGHAIPHHLYADDSQLYISFSSANSAAALNGLQSCLASVQSWMLTNKLKLNPYKTEVLIGNDWQRSKYLSMFPIEFLGVKTYPAKSARNLGVIFDKTSNFRPHISAICSSCIYYIRDLWCIRRHLDLESAKLLANALVSSCLDYCNLLL